jgi:hypothetical protein
MNSRASTYPVASKDRPGRASALTKAQRGHIVSFQTEDGTALMGKVCQVAATEHLVFVPSQDGQRRRAFYVVPFESVLAVTVDRQ